MPTDPPPEWVLRLVAQVEQVMRSKLLPGQKSNYLPLRVVVTSRWYKLCALRKAGDDRDHCYIKIDDRQNVYSRSGKVPFGRASNVEGFQEALEPAGLWLYPVLNPGEASMASAVGPPTKKARPLREVQLPSIYRTRKDDVLEQLLEEDPSHTVYRHQVQATLEAKKFFDGNPSGVGLVVIPTGGGKTGVAALVPYAIGATRVLIITPSAWISEQNRDAIGLPRCNRHGKHTKPFVIARHLFPDEKLKHHMFLPTVGLAKESRDIPALKADTVLIANAHKISERASTRVADLPTDYELVIVDEAHHYPATTWSDIVNHFPSSKRLFLTATPDYVQQRPEVTKVFEATRASLEGRGIIRPVKFTEVKADGTLHTAVFKVGAVVTLPTRRAAGHRQRNPSSNEATRRRASAPRRRGRQGGPGVPSGHGAGAVHRGDRPSQERGRHVL